MRIVDARRSASAGLVAALLLAPAPAAPALEPGVHADPGSPAAKEYALPLTQARQTGSQHGGGLFGAGIRSTRRSHGRSRQRTAGARQRSARQRSAGASRGAGAIAGARGGAAGPETAVSEEGAALPAAVRNASRARAGGGNGSLLALLGGGVAVLALGLLGGIALRGRVSSARPDAQRRGVGSAARPARR